MLITISSMFPLSMQLQGLKPPVDSTARFMGEGSGPDTTQIRTNFARDAALMSTNLYHAKSTSHGSAYVMYHYLHIQPSYSTNR